MYAHCPHAPGTCLALAADGHGDVLADSPGDQLRSGLDTQLGEDVLQLRLDRARGDQQLFGNLAIGQPTGNQRGDILFAASEDLSRRRCLGGQLRSGLPRPTRQRKCVRRAGCAARRPGARAPLGPRRAAVRP